MKIAVSSSGNSLDSTLDPRFGRCAYFLIVNPADTRYEVFNNQGAAQSRGAGIQAAKFLVAKDVTAVISGHVRPNVLQVFAAANIETFVAEQGTIKEVVERYKSGGLRPTRQTAVGAQGVAGGKRCGGRNRTGKGPGGARGMGRCGGTAEQQRIG